MKILAIRLARLGDLILLLPALKHLKDSFSEAQLTLLTGNLCASLSDLCPWIDEVIAIDRVGMRDGPVLSAVRRGMEVVSDVRRRHFDLVVDFHSFRETNLLTWLSGAPHRLGIKRFQQSYLGFCFNEPPVLEDKNLHVAEMFMRVIERFATKATSEGPLLVVPDRVRQWVRESLPRRRHIALYVDAPSQDRIWAAENFAALGDHAVESWDADILVISGRNGESLVQRVLRCSRHPDRLAAFSNLTLSQLAGIIESSELLVSNDTGPMHFGPALRVPTIGLFSVGLPEHFRPTGPNDIFIRANPIELIAVREVVKAMDLTWASLGPSFRYLS